MLKRILLAVAITMTGLVSAHAEHIHHGSLMISDAVMRAALPGGKVTAAYMTITNMGGQDDALVAVRYNGAKKSEIHTMEMVSDVMKMRPVDGALTIPAGQTVRLKPGGLHLMFMGLTERPMAGDEAIISLDFEKAGPLTLTLPVEKLMSGHKKTSDQVDDHNHDQ